MKRRQYIVIDKGCEVYVGPRLPRKIYGSLWVRDWDLSLTNPVTEHGDWGPMRYCYHLNRPYKERRK